MDLRSPSFTIGIQIYTGAPTHSIIPIAHRAAAVFTLLWWWQIVALSSLSSIY